MAMAEESTAVFGAAIEPTQATTPGFHLTVSILNLLSSFTTSEACLIGEVRLLPEQRSDTRYSMSFYFTLILLHRPFLRASSACRDEGNNDHAYIDSLVTCIQASDSIGDLVLGYGSSWSLRQVPPSLVHFIFLAGSIHLVNSRLYGGTHSDQRYMPYIEALREIGKSYPIAQQASSALQGAAARWKPSNQVEKSEHDYHMRRSSISMSAGRDPRSAALKTDIPRQKHFGATPVETSPGRDPLTVPDNDLFSNGNLYEDFIMNQGADESKFPMFGMDWLSENALFDTVDGSNLPIGV